MGWRRIGPAIGLCALTAGACGEDSLTGVRDVGTQWHTVEVLGSTRRFRTYVPPELDRGGSEAGPPLLLVFHGASQGAAGIELMSWLYPAADSAGMIVAYPEASGDYWNTPNSPPEYWSAPDVPFTEAVIEDLVQRHGVDRSRVYAAGFSNGAIFAQLLSCLRGDAIAAFAAVGAGISASVSTSCPWQRPVAATVFFGDSDPQFFWDEGLAAAVGMLGGSTSAAWLAEHNECDPEPNVVDLGEDAVGQTAVELWRFRSCAEGADVDFYRIVRGGHTWPGSPVNMDAGFGRKSRSLDASATMVDFFLSHGREP